MMTKQVALIILISIIGYWNYSYAQSVNFTGSVYSGCPPLAVSFTNTSTVGNNFTWTIENNVDSNVNTSYTFVYPGNYWVYLYAYDSIGNFAGYDYTVIEVYDSSGSFFISDTSLCPDEEVVFHTWANANSYQWDFGDGTTATSSRVYHAYASPGIYDVRLILDMFCGAANDSIIKQVNVDSSLSPPSFTFVPSPQLSINSNYHVCPDETLAFYIQPSSGSYDEDLTFQWDFGDGETFIGRSPKHSFSSTGIFLVTLTVYNSCGVSTSFSDTIFSVDTNSVPPPIFYNYLMPGCSSSQLRFAFSGNYPSVLWDFGDGSVDTTLNPVHTFPGSGSYIVSLTVVNSCGSSNTFSDTLAVSDTLFPMNTPFFQLFEDSICPGDLVYTFAWSWSYYNDLTFLWDFGDGTQDTVETVSHTYPNIGIYPVTKTITSSCGYLVSYIDTVVVTNSAAPPIPYFDDPQVCPGDSIKFECYTPIPATFGQRLPYTAYMMVWEYGDGVIDTTYSSYAYHAYSAIGNYNVTVTAINGCGNSNTYNGHVIVANNSVPTAYFSWQYDANGLNACDSIAFTTELSWSTSNVNYSYNWDFGDGNTMTTSSKLVKHVFANPGAYTVVLTASNNCGNSSKQFVEVIIEGPCLETGMQSAKKESLGNMLIYPNPSAGRFTVEMEILEAEEYVFSVVNILGQEVYSEREKLLPGISRMEISMQHVPKGVYIFQASSKSSSLSRMIVIE